MVRHRRLLPLLPICVLLAACATRPFDHTTVPGGKPLGPTTAGTVVIAGDELTADPTLTLLDALRKAMPQMRTEQGAAPGSCPTIALRGKDSITGSSDPDIYVDGTRTADTCPLTMISAIDAQRVEVYPLGVTPRAGYSSSGHGLILIFLQRADGSGQ